MKIYTKTGDKGDTSLYDGTRVSKDDIRVESYGTIDELDSALGFSRNFIQDKKIIEIVYKIQRDLFKVAAELATEDNSKIVAKVQEEDIIYLESIINEYMEKIPKVDKFIIPGTSVESASLHMARTICRRAERRIITLRRSAEIRDDLVKYVNRLSDAIYTIARYLEKELIYL
ncbi:cob(I)yrinic acid a,c-diamide adenosyltransferase [Alkaliphilus serpentinus]|uniref:Corrinoid adenosyltransferase n=1 Tax=Alkaliphilus serpentinus TaxID=1482731 RepID=A0A833HRD4_9FIRM|nr:cob(I)yrinic acid a,c-diamide adenosyltransferase [Alkaliphilus serpentinus]KAB3533213.1 cob(I)yrinic acid a,c-diamide adenosyltransferase [Alkaliphilus serpentinus]